MAKYILNRLWTSLVTLFALITIVFFLVRMLPGNPFADPKLSPDVKENLFRYYGLDKPIHVQYAHYIKNLLHGDLGYSLKYRNETINRIIKEAFPYSADLGIRSVILSTFASIALGIMAALKKNSFWDWLCIIIATLGLAIPDFVFGTVMQFLFGVKLKILPVAEWKSFKSTIMPVLTMSIGTIAWMSMMMKASMIDVASQDYIKTAKSKGLSQRQIIWKHQIRNAIMPIVTSLGTTVAGILTGTFIIEQIFAVPGLGKFFASGIQNLDYSMVLGLTTFFGAFLIVCNFVVDIVYGFIDPRIRISEK
ncbi:MAG TPA: ABC transporter permease [Clostridia bacterium]|nr:ABC transporter permease [Clostridia bacterium]